LFFNRSKILEHASVNDVRKHFALQLATVTYKF